ncbi:hypothetical protein SteCoe_25969 [Stentor coeruleus]|uniref:Uncharacterized protein n=1 Tax=Stentor coeruleus TaxID=5963 RepID=A0A1R2BE17_9CILI|nr:hypothetical protein SteCoe_25969 [Stentor coeruleus]
MEKAKQGFENEIHSKNAKENPQILMTAIEMVVGLLIALVASAFSIIYESLQANFWFSIIAIACVVLIPLSTKASVLHSSDFIRVCLFFIFIASASLLLVYLSMIIESFFYGIWLYLTSALLIFYEYNGIAPGDLKKSFKVVVCALFIMSALLCILLIMNFDIFLAVKLAIAFVLSTWVSYALITSAIAVDELKKGQEINRDSLMEDNLIVWRSFPIQLVKTFPDFVNYLRSAKR